MNKRGLSDSIRFGSGAALIFFGAWLFGQYQGYVQLLGIAFIAAGIGLVISGFK